VTAEPVRRAAPGHRAAELRSGDRLPALIFHARGHDPAVGPLLLLEVDADLQVERAGCQIGGE
jgi:hypothetical protein